MNRLPNFENAYVDIEKLTGYCLNEEHPIGKEKAIVFKSALGIASGNANLLKDAILKGIKENSSDEKGTDKFGKRYSVNIKVRIFDKEAVVITGWIIKKGENFPTLTTCYIKRKNEK